MIAAAQTPQVVDVQLSDLRVGRRMQSRRPAACSAVQVSMFKLRLTHLGGPLPRESQVLCKAQPRVAVDHLQDSKHVPPDSPSPPSQVRTASMPPWRFRRRPCGVQCGSVGDAWGCKGANELLPSSRPWSARTSCLCPCSAILLRMMCWHPRSQSCHSCLVSALFLLFYDFRPALAAAVNDLSFVALPGKVPLSLGRQLLCTSPLLGSERRLGTAVRDSTRTGRGVWSTISL